MTDARARIDALIARGMAAQRADRLGEAERAYRAALAIDRTDPQALALLGTLAGLAGRFAAAIELFVLALRRDPANADLYHNLGETYRQLGETGKALPAFNRAIELRPDRFEAYRTAADTAIAAAEKAEASAGDARQREVRRTHASELRRIAAQYLLKLGFKRYARRLGGVEQIFREAAALDPDDEEVVYALGSILQESSAPTEAVAVLRRAIALAPRAYHAYNNLGAAYFALRRWAESEDAYRAALAMKPDFALASQSLRSTSLMRRLYDSISTSEEIFECHRAWGAQITAELAPVAARMPPFGNSRDPDRRLRVGYLSGDFREHSVSYFLAPLLRHRDRAAVEVFCYSEVDNPDATTEALRQDADTWRDVFELSDDALRAQLRADRIDIAIDLAGQTAKNRLAALAVKAAPVTATWLGYAATTGLPAIDYRITDAIADPSGSERFHTEKLVRLSDGFLCYQPLAAGVPAAPPPPVLAAGRVTFGSFNNPLKISPATIAAWARILAAVPRSRLLLKAPTLSDPGVRGLILDGFAASGIGAERIEFQGFALIHDRASRRLWQDRHRPRSIPL